MVIKTETEVKQVVGKRKNKKRYLLYILCRCPCPVDSHGRVDGLYSSVFTRSLPKLLYPSNKTLLQFSCTHFPDSSQQMAKQAPDTDKGRDTLRDQTRFQLVSTK